MDDPGGRFLAAFFTLGLTVVIAPLNWVVGFVFAAAYLDIEPVESTWTSGDIAQLIVVWLAAIIAQQVALARTKK